MTDEVSPGGSEIKRYDAREPELVPAGGDPDLIDGLTAHVQKHLDQECEVFHELVSDVVHVDVLLASPTEDLPFHTLMTCGLSELPMAAPPELPEARYAEVMLRLPSDWPLEQEAIERDESAYWPLRLLKFLARFPHEYDTWIGYGHTIPHGDPPAPFAPNTELCGAIVLPPLLGPEGFETASVAGRQINVLGVVPIHADEMELKLEKGTDALVDLLDQAGLSELLDPGRRSVVRRRRLFRR
jgi:suppressor of fused protein SUFU